MEGIIPGVRRCASGNRASSHCWRACACVSGERTAARMRDGSSGLLPGCGKPAVASSIIWLIATAPALGAVVTPGVAGAGVGDLTVLTLAGDGVGVEGVTILAGLTARGVAGMLGGRSGVGAGEDGGALAVTVMAGRVPLVPLISGSSVASTTARILAARNLSRNHPFGRKRLTLWVAVQVQQVASA